MAKAKTETTKEEKDETVKTIGAPVPEDTTVGEQAAQQTETLPDANETPRAVRSKFVAIRREEIIAPGGAVNFNVAFEVAGVKRDTQMKQVPSENDFLWTQSSKPIGAITLAGVVRDVAFHFEVGKEYFVDFSPAQTE
jgi:hypothetical protein